MAERTDAHIFLRLIYQALLNAGLPAEAILVKAGVALSRLEDSSLSRTPSHAQLAFWRAAEEMSGDSHIGLHLGEHMPLYRGQVLEYLLTSSPTFGEGLRRAMNFHRLLSDSLTGELVVEGDTCYLATITDRKASRHFTECLAAGMIRFFKFVTDGRFRAIAIHTEHSEGRRPRNTAASTAAMSRWAAANTACTSIKTCWITASGRPSRISCACMSRSPRNSSPSCSASISSRK